MRSTLVALVALGWLWPAAAAHADDFMDYGRVICSGQDIVLQFSFVEVGTPPTYAPLPDGRNFDVAQEHAASCDFEGSDRFIGGATVQLMQGYLDDARAFGFDSGWSTPIFTLRIDDEIAFRRRSIREHGGPRRGALRTVIVHGDNATLCWESGECQNEAIAFTNDEALRRIDTLAVTPIRERDRALCEALVVSKERYGLRGSIQATWPTYLHDPRDTIVGDNWNGTWNEPRQSFDLDNDGRVDRPLEVSGYGGMGGNFGYWTLPPYGIDDAERMRMAGALSMSTDDATVSQLRRQGWIFYTGADTRFGDNQWVYLNLLLYGDETYLLAEHRGEPVSVLMKPMPNGRMREVCVYERAPDL